MNNIFAVTYFYDQARTEAVVAARPKHREFLRGLYAAGQLLASGPTDDGNALLIVRAEDANGALALLDPDPMREAGVITDRNARGWNAVIGPWAEN